MRTPDGTKNMVNCYQETTQRHVNFSLSFFFISTEHGKESVNRNSNRKQTRRANPHIQTHAVYHYLSYLLQKKGCCNSATSLQCLKQSCCPLRTGTVQCSLSECLLSVHKYSSMHVLVSDLSAKIIMAWHDILVYQVCFSSGKYIYMMRLVDSKI